MSLDTLFNHDDLEVGNYFGVTAIRHEYNKPSKIEVYVARYLGIDVFELHDPTNSNINRYRVKWNPWHNYLVNQIFDYHLDIDSKNKVPRWLYIDSYRLKFTLDYYIKFDFKTATPIKQFDITKTDYDLNIDLDLEPIKKKRKTKN